MGQRTSRSEGQVVEICSPGLVAQISQPGLEPLEILEREQIFLQLADRPPKICDIAREVAHDRTGRDARERGDAELSPEATLRVQHLLVEFDELSLQDLVVVLQPLFADVVDCGLVDVFQLELELQQLQQVVAVVSLIGALHSAVFRSRSCASVSRSGWIALASFR